MEYKRIYDFIINKAKQENREKCKGIYYEGHHIKPKCIGGKGQVHQKNHPNIVLLTAKEHFICHKLLVEIYRNTKFYSKMTYALWSMSIQKLKQRDYRISSREYERIRFEYSKIKNKPILQYNLNGEFIREWSSILEAISILNLTSSGIQACCDKVQKTAYGFIWRRKIKKIPNKIKIPKLIRKPFKEGVLNVPHPNMGIPILQYNLNGEFIREWSSSKEAFENNQVKNQGDISACCRGKQKTANNFIWKYKDKGLEKEKMVPIIKLNKEGILIEEYLNIKEAAKQNNLIPKNLIHCLKGKSKSAYGFIWKYK